VGNETYLEVNMTSPLLVHFASFMQRNIKMVKNITKYSFKNRSCVCIWSNEWLEKFT